jgi:hypothetical protein
MTEETPLTGAVTGTGPPTAVTLRKGKGSAELHAGDITGAVMTVNKGKRSVLAMDVEEAAHQAEQNDGGLILEFTYQPLFYKDGVDHAEASGEPPQRWRLKMERVPD